MPIAVHLGVRRGVERKRFHSASGPSTRRARALSTREILEEELRSIVSNQRLRFPEISSDEDPPISNQLLRRLMSAVMRLLWSGCHAERSEFETTEQQITEEDIAIVVSHGRKQNHDIAETSTLRRLNLSEAVRGVCIWAALRSEERFLSSSFDRVMMADRQGTQRTGREQKVWDLHNIITLLRDLNEGEEPTSDDIATVKDAHVIEQTRVGVTADSTEALKRAVYRWFLSVAHGDSGNGDDEMTAREGEIDIRREVDDPQDRDLPSHGDDSHERWSSKAEASTAGMDAVFSTEIDDSKREVKVDEDNEHENTLDYLDGHKSASDSEIV